jgi:hypothetical protein
MDKSRYIIIRNIRNFVLFFLTVISVQNCRAGETGGNRYIERTTEDGIQNSSTENLGSDSTGLNFTGRINELKSKLSSDFIVKEHSYFVIASNLSESETDKILDNTIDKAVDCFYNDYFSKKPDEATTIFLFKDDKTYRYWAKQLYDDDDLSRYGYYKPSEKTMLMNINTGTGTLVHEMTHALVRYDFPDIPSWFNEGLGSLYERCSLNNKTILGYVNWRLPALQDAIADKSYTTLDKLMKTDWETFYGNRSDVNYAQARYLCMYLQEKGLLKKYYKLFRDTYSEDKTGIKQIESITGKSVSELDKEYVEWVNTLKYE